LFIYSSVAVGAAASTAGATSTASAAGATTSAVASPSLSEPLSESPSTIAAVTKDKILSIDLEASSFEELHILLHEDQSLYQPLQNWNV
jgi:hypothetical protein